MTREPKVFSGESIVSSINGAGKTGYSHARRTKLDLYLKPFTRIYLKWNKDLNVKPETIKLLEDEGKNIIDTGLDHDFLDVVPKAQATKAKTKKWNCIKPESFCIAKETINRIKRQPTEWKKI